MVDQVATTLKHLGLEDQLIVEIVQAGRLMKVREEQPLISPGTKSMEMPMVIEGTLRIMRDNDDENEVFLYYLEGGDACAMSISCCLGNQMSHFKAIAETDATLWMVPMMHIDEWMGKYQSFRKFIIDSYQARFDEMMLTIDSIAFMKMDERLMKYLLDKKQSTGSFEIHKTHQQIATELNTSRVVVSRLLKKLESDDRIELHRNRIEVL